MQQDWKRTMQEAVLDGALQDAMRRTPQEAQYHGEGSVLRHTELVCRAMAGLDAFARAEEDTQRMLYLSALVHDIGKVTTTAMEDGRWRTRGHARVGAQMARQILWQRLGLCGTKQAMQLREAVCAMVRDHGLPLHALDDADAERRLLRAAEAGALAPQFTLARLCALVEADVRGRICADQQAMLERLRLCRELAEEAGCLYGPYAFASDHTRFSYFAGKNIRPDQTLYDGTWGEVILMSGLPGTGKDTWIGARYAALPVISLDEIRKALGVLPTHDQRGVAAEAHARAKEYLRKKQPFVWNATNLTPQLRQKQISLFTAYGARVKIVYLETSWQEQLRRNRSRADAVPEEKLRRMLELLAPPSPFEAHAVEWHCV